MQSSAAVAVRALIMLACVVGIPALALSGTSWSEMLKKFQDFRWPAILSPASASIRPMAATQRSPDAFRRPSPSPACRLRASTARRRPAGRPGACRRHGRRSAVREIQDPAASVGGHVLSAGVVGQRTATVPLLLQDGRGRQCRLHALLRGHHADPLQAMLQVLQQVETWRETEGEDE